MSRTISAHEAPAIILSYLARLDSMLTMANGSGQNSLSQSCEGLVAEIFSCIEGEIFSSTNLEISNFPSIDLECPKRKIAIQVTSSRGNSKVIDTLEVFLKKRLDLRYDRLIVVILANKNYQTQIIEKKLADLNADFGTSFTIDLAKDLVDLKALYKTIVNGVGNEKLLSVHGILERFFDGIHRQNDLKPYHSKLLDMFYEPVMDEESGMTLSGIYVDPGFIIHSLSGQVGSPELNFTDDHNLMPLEEVSIHEFLNKKLGGDNSYDSLLMRPASKVSIVLGYPGQGKTSMCKKLLNDLLSFTGHRNVFYIKLKDIVDTRSLIHNPFNVICDQLETDLGSGFSKDMLKNSITVLDGLDELYMKDNLKSDDIETLVKGIIHTADRMTDWNVVLTTRHGYINFDRLYKENYTGILLKPFGEHKQNEWLEKYLTFHPDTWMDADFLFDVNYSESGHRHFLAELIDQPLLIYIIASLDHKVDVDASRTEIYNLLFDQIIERKYSKDGQIENLKNLTREDLRFMLQEIAYLIFKSGKGYVNSNDLFSADSLEDLIAKIGDGHLADSLKGILISFYFKEVRDGRNSASAGIEFFHKSLQEYLTAERIVNVVFDTLLNKDRQENYIVRKGGGLLSFLNDVFGPQQITFEIWEFILQLIKKRSEEERKELSERLSIHIDYLFEKDFVAGVVSGAGGTFSTILRTFSAYWQFLKAANSNSDFIKGKSFAGKFFTFHQAIESLNRLAQTEKRLNAQVIVGIGIGNLSLVGENFSDVVIDRCAIHELTLMDCDVEGASLMNSRIESLNLDDNKGEIHFNQCTVGKMEIQLARSSRATFDNCVINFIDLVYLRLKNSLEFSECTFTPESYEAVEKHRGKIKFTSCQILTEKLNKRSFEVKTKTFPISDT